MAGFENKLTSELTNLVRCYTAWKSFIHYFNSTLIKMMFMQWVTHQFASTRFEWFHISIKIILHINNCVIQYLVLH